MATIACIEESGWCDIARGLRPKLDEGHHSIPAAETISDHSSAGIGTLEYSERGFWPKGY